MCKVQLGSAIRGRAPAATALLLSIPFLWLSFAALPLQAQTYTVLHAFTGNGDGSIPEAVMTLDKAGNLYGTTANGGAFAKGTVFEFNAEGKETILHNFWAGDGLFPDGLIRDQAGTFYGTAGQGGTPEGGECEYGCGAVFKLDKAGKESVLYAFTGNADGSSPGGGLVRDEAGTLYGVTWGGGDGYDSYGCGVVFKLDAHGKETVLYTFSRTSYGCASSTGGLVQDNAGNLYGSARQGAYGAGFVFKLNPAGQMTVLYNFTGGADGGWPQAPLLRDAGGNLYGAAAGGGDLSLCKNGCGVVFKLDPTGNESVLYAFKGSPDGFEPNGGLVRDKAGSFYGTTWLGGSTECTQYGDQGCGTIFELDTSGNETVLYSFTGGNDGDNPSVGLTIDGSGNLYGTTPEGGDSSCDQGYGCGVVFKLEP